SFGLLVLATFGIGRRLGDDLIGLIGAWLVATSPVVLFMSVAPMTDVPVAAVWAAAFYWLLGTTATTATAAGFLSALAVLVRPNLAPLAGILALRFVLRCAVGTVGVRHSVSCWHSRRRSSPGSQRWRSSTRICTGRRSRRVTARCRP